MKTPSVINLDPIDAKNKKKLSLIGKVMITRIYGGKTVKKSEPFGHYMFCGKQRSGKSVSAIWYMEKLAKRYKKKRVQQIDEKGKVKLFKEKPTLKLYSNIGLGKKIDRKNLYETIKDLDPYANEVRFIIIDEIHTYFPREGMDKEGAEIKNKLINIFCQLGKRNVYILSTSQVYGRVEKSLREQCLFMINCKTTVRGKLKNEFIDADDILCDELGRWAGKPKSIYIHGLPKHAYDTKLIITI
jgi:hypothetical protein